MSESKTGYAQVTGVLKYNNSTREEMLRRNYWKDEEYTKYGAGIGEYHKIETRLISPIGEGVSLYDYTQNENSEYGKEINKKYIPSNIEKENYETTPLMQDMRKWEGNYVEIFNDNNKLGEVGDAQYLQLMTFAGYANSDRFLSEKYLTPGLASFYGSNPQIEGENGYFNVFNRVGGVYKHESGRIAEIAETNVAQIVEYAKAKENEKNYGGLYYFEQNVSFAEEEQKNKGYTNETYGLSHYTTTAETIDKKGNTTTGTVIETKVKEYVNYTREPNKPIGVISDTFNLGNQKSILAKTSKIFQERKVKNLFSRNDEYDNNVEGDYFDTGKNSTYGHSHGRNLLKLGATSGEPFCRNWTWYRKYDKYSDLIRPFADGSDISDIQEMNKNFRAVSGNTLEKGNDYLSRNTVLSNVGYVNITPSSSEDSKVEIKKCMFSIENLAWKDVNKEKGYFSKEQQGPNGGRIMWFPPYDLEFQENVQVDWDPSVFIGRGEKVYTYKNTDRTGTLSFTMLIDHPNIINELKNKVGMDPDHNLEEDVLRFFAGNKILNLNDKTEDNQTSGQDTQGDNPQLVPSEENTKKIIFYIFFPNAYSGNYAYLNPPNRERDGYGDADLFRYLIHGKGIYAYLTDTTEWNGYEITENGISTNGSESELGKIKIKSYSKSCHLGYRGEENTESEEGYYYATDFDMSGKLNNSDNYVDSLSFQLNSKLEGNEEVLVDANYTFAEVMAALYKDEDITNHIISAVGTEVTSAISALTEIFESDTKFVSAKVEGMATLQGDTNSCKYSEALAMRRAKAVAKLLKDTILKGSDANIETVSSKTETLNDETSINTKEAKAQRCVKVEISYNPPSIDKASDKKGDEISGDTLNIQETLDESNALVEKLMDEEEKELESLIASALEEVINDSNKSVRYETESEYFEKLSKESPFVFDKITDKFKYFSPAFHSISPEGFNARLNFLHQCTRQGHTIESNTQSGYANTATNLSFGRMPVCVLRIGDFINTRILIQSLTINYDNNGGMQWDLNPEGVGVQPMYAKINLGIVILGGQSLEGPISRLQNAVSFDYYANTGVYDNRADRVTVEDGKTNYKYLWNPTS